MSYPSYIVSQQNKLQNALDKFVVHVHSIKASATFSHQKHGYVHVDATILEGGVTSYKKDNLFRVMALKNGRKHGERKNVPLKMQRKSKNMYIYSKFIHSFKN